MTDPHDKTLGDYLDRTGPARRAIRDQAVAAIREKIERLTPELQQSDPEAARKRLTLVFLMMDASVDRAAFAEVLASYVISEERP